MTEGRRYIISAEVMDLGGTKADIKVSMSEVTEAGEISLPSPEQCSSLSVYMAFYSMVKSFQPDYRTAVDAAAELLAASLLKVLASKSAVVFPQEPSKTWLIRVLEDRPELMGMSLALAKKSIDRKHTPAFMPDLLEHLYESFEPEDYADTAYPILTDLALKNDNRRKKWEE